MKILGVPLNRPDKGDFCAIGVTALIGLPLLYPMLSIVEPQVVLGLFFSAITGAVLASMGVKVQEGIRHLAIIIMLCLPMAFLGNITGLFISNLLS